MKNKGKSNRIQMKKTSFFLFLLLVSIFLFVTILVTGFLLTPAVTNPSDWTTNMWGCMGDWMAGGTLQGADSSWVLFGVLLFLSVGLIIVGGAGTLYFYLFPEIRSTKTVIQPELQTPKASESSFESVLKTLTDDECKVLEILEKNDGKYLQKYIRADSKLSRLKTHRIIARFAKRGMVTLEKVGNTNEVTIAEWLKKQN